MKTPVEFRNNSVQILRLFEVARALEAELAAERAARRRADERAESLALAAHHSAAAAERTEEAESARCAPDFTNVWHNPLDFFCQRGVCFKTRENIKILKVFNPIKKKFSPAARWGGSIPPRPPLGGELSSIT